MCFHLCFKYVICVTLDILLNQSDLNCEMEVVLAAALQLRMKQITEWKETSIVPGTW